MDDNLSTKQRVLFYGHKIDKLLSYLFAAGVVIGVTITLFEYRLNLYEDKEFINKILILPASLTLLLGAIIALLRVIHESFGFGVLREINKIVIFSPIGLKLTIQLIYVVTCTIFMLFGGYTFSKAVIGVHIKLIKLFI